jgi:hypothetical protein
MEPVRDRIPDEPVVDGTIPSGPEREQQLADSIERFHLVLPRRYPLGAPIMRAYVTGMSVLNVQNVRLSAVGDSEDRVRAPCSR